MSKASKDSLFSLVTSLTKAEKRSFRVYVNRLQSGEEGLGEPWKFLQLFDVLDKMPEYNEPLILKKLSGVIEKKQLPNLKRHLYKQILISLRLIYIQKNIDIQIREQIDFARILYGKGMYMEALKLLERIKQTAVEHHQDILHMEVIEFQKLIEARHITRSRRVEGKLEGLLDESARRSEVIQLNNALFTFNIQIHGWYIQHGHARSPEKIEEINDFFGKNLPGIGKSEQLTFFEKANLYQAKMWYAYILLDIKGSKKYALRWVSLFAEYPPMREKDPDLYMRGLYYLLVSLLFLRDIKEFEHYLTEFEFFLNAFEGSLNPNSGTIAFVYINLSRLNFYMLKKDFEAGVRQISTIEKELEQHEQYSDIHRTLLFYYKFAYFHFGCGHIDKALDYLNEIILLQRGYLREDLHHNARLLHLICHYELGNIDLLHYLIPSVQRAFNKGKEVTKVQIETLKFLKRLADLPAAETKSEFQRFSKRIVAISTNPLEQKALLYLDVPAWAESRLANCRLKDLPIQKKQPSTI